MEAARDPQEPRVEEATGTSSSGHVDRLDALKRLADLRDSGVLSEEEFDSEKRRILAE